MQPLVGVIADNSRSKWGRRRPFMIGGSIIVALFLLVLGWTAEIVGAFVTNADAVGYPPVVQGPVFDSPNREPYGLLLLPSSAYML